MGSADILLESSKSGELTAALQTLSECEIDGMPKYCPSTCREISKILVCRTYAAAVLELCHLVKAASELSDLNRYEYFFWDSGAAQTANFRSYCLTHIENYQGSLVRHDHAKLTLTYADTAFSVHYSRMPVLAALLEFCLTALGYTDMDEILQDLMGPEVGSKDISQTANSLSRLIYSYLSHHLPSAQSQRKFRKLLAYCEDDTDTVDDAMVLNFWQEASVEQDKGVDFKTFDAVFLSFTRLIQAVETARDLSAMRHAQSIGADFEQGEVDPDVLSSTLETVEETLSPLIRLTSSPLNQVKFLKKQEYAKLETLLSIGDLALRLPLSVLRANIFTKEQSKLTQALRRRAQDHDLKNIITEGPDETYQDRQITYDAIKNELERSAYASLHALAQAKSQEAISVLLKLHPGINYQPLAQHLNLSEGSDNVVALHTPKMTEHFMDLLKDGRQMGPELASVMEQAQAAHKAISRKGFKEDLTQHPDLLNAFIEGGNLVLDLAHDIDAFLERLDNLPLAGGGWQSQFSFDRTIFNGQFSKIYGSAS